MMKKTKITLLTTLFFLLPVFLSAQVVGDNAPNFSFPSTDGDSIKLSDYEGKVLVIFVFGNGCPFCVGAGDDIESKLHQAFKNDDNFAIVGVDTWNSSSSVTSVKNFKSNSGVTFKLAYKAGDFASLYSTTYDRLIVIDSKGKISYKGTSNAENTVDAVATEVGDLLKNIDVVTAIDKQESFESGYINLYPNPLTNSGTFSLQLSKNCSCSIDIFNAVGTKMMEILNENLEAGEYTLQFDASKLPSGIYFYQLDNGTTYQTKKFSIY